MILSISWRNIWRNKIRSTVVIVAIAVGVCAGIYTTAVMLGFVDKRINQVISIELSHIQIHHPAFLDNAKLENYIPNGRLLADSIKNTIKPLGVSPRLILNSMAQSAETATGVRVNGIVPEAEGIVNEVSQKIIEGSWFEPGNKHPAVIGSKLAEKLKIKLHSKLILMIQDKDNNIVASAFRVTGIFKTPNSTFDELNIYLEYKELAGIVSLPEEACHEIAVLCSEHELVPEVQGKIKAMVPSLDVQNWKELSPEMNYMTEAMDMYMYIFIIIILITLLFGIINTMLMVVLERSKELGMLMAVGMGKRKIFTMIMTETVLLSLWGGILGVVLGWLISKFGETHPLNLSMYSEAYSSMGWDPVIYTHLEGRFAYTVTFMVFVTGIIAALYPAYKALKNDPAEALRIE